MPDVGVNSVSVLGRELLLVDVGGGAETHLAATDDQPTAGCPRRRSHRLGEQSCCRRVRPRSTARSAVGAVDVVRPGLVGDDCR